MTPSTRKRIAIVAGIGLALVGLPLLILVLLAHSPERRVALLLSEAQIHRRTGRLDLEAEKLEKALAIMPRDAGLMAKLARNNADRGETARSEELYKASLAINPDNIEAGFELEEVEKTRGELDDASRLLDDLEKRAQTLASQVYRDRVLVARADLALRRGDERTALVALEAALQVDPVKDAGVRLALVSVYAGRGDVERAEELARSLWTVRRPDSVPAPKDGEKATGKAYLADAMTARTARVLGGLLLARGAVDEAARVLAEGRSRDAADQDLALALVDAEIARGRFDAALAIATALDAEKHPASAAMARGRVALARGEKERARKEFGDATAWAPGTAAPALAAAACALEAGDKAEAKRLALAIETKHASLDERVARCRVLRETGLEPQAREEVAGILATAPGHAGAIDLLVRMFLAENKPGQAAKELDALEARSPGNRIIKRARTMLALWASDPTRAVALSREDVTGAGDEGGVQFLSAALALEGGVGAAVRELERLSQDAPDEAVRVRARLKAAELYRALGRSDLAIPILSRGLAEHPMTRELRLALARTLLGANRAGEAEKTLAPLLDGEGDPQAIILAAEAARAQSAWPRAIALARRAEADAVHGDEACAIEALAFRSAGDRDGARAAFLKLRERRPSAPLGYVGALCDLGADPVESAAVLKKACDVLGPASFDLDLAVALDLASRSSGSVDDEPVKLAHAALQRAANDETAAFVEAAALLRRGRSDEAGATLAAAGVAIELRGALAALSWETLGRLELLLALRRHRFDQEAATVAKALLETGSKNLVLAIFGARALAAAGDAARAKEVLGAAVATAPKSVPCRLELGLLLGSAKETRAEALALFEQGTGLVSESAQLALGRAMTLEELGRADDALAAYRQVIVLDPRNAIARNNLAWLLVQKGTPDAVAEALAISRTVVAEMPNLPAALDTLSRVLMAKGDLGPALEDAQKATRLAPLDAGIRLTFARALDALGRKQDAANQYEVSLLLSSSFEGRAEAEKRLAQLRAGSR